MRGDRLRENTKSANPVIIQSPPNSGSEQMSTMKCETEELLQKKTILEDVLIELKFSGPYHLRFMLILNFLLVISSGFTMNYLFTAEVVNYRCKYANCIDDEMSQLEQNSTLNIKCHLYELIDPNGTCTENNFNISDVTDCSEWIYEDPNSFVAEFDLGCQDWKRALVGTVHSIGYMFGLLLLGPLSDKFGRKKIIIFNTLFAGMAGILRSMTQSYWIFVTLEMLESLLGDNYTAIYTMAIEMVTTKSRPMVTFLFSVATTFSYSFMSLAAYLSPNWRIYLISLYTPAFLIILVMFWLDESLRWLLVKGKKAEVEQVIRQAAKLNNMEIETSKIVNLESEERSEQIGLQKSIKLTFSSKKLIVRLILCICIWFTVVFNAYTLLVNSVLLEGDKYVNFGLVSISSTISGIILLYVLTKFQRKVPLILSLVFNGAFCVAQSLVPKGYRWLSTLLFLSGKVTASVAIRTAYLYTAELFPTYTRHTMLALCSAVGRIGAILAPLTPLLLVYWSGLPSLLVGIVSLVTATIVTMMPDTAETILPDNVQQAETIGRN